VQPKGKDTGALGPSDSSDSGSDVQAGEPRTALAGGGPYASGLATDTDAAATGERASAEEGVAADADLLPDCTGVRPDSAAGARVAAGEEDSVRAADLMKTSRKASTKTKKAPDPVQNGIILTARTGRAA
jgi:hypothetical protein